MGARVNERLYDADAADPSRVIAQTRCHPHAYRSVRVAERPRSPAGASTASPGPVDCAVRRWVITAVLNA